MFASDVSKVIAPFLGKGVQISSGPCVPAVRGVALSLMAQIDLTESLHAMNPLMITFILFPRCGGESISSSCSFFLVCW